ncbi:MAG: Aspartate aminotransferase, mitochondrial [Paramarteilia canceri]
MGINLETFSDSTVTSIFPNSDEKLVYSGVIKVASPIHLFKIASNLSHLFCTVARNKSKVCRTLRNWMEERDNGFYKYFEKVPKDPIIGLQEKFDSDPNVDKINLGIGAYKDGQGKPYILNCVRKVLFNIFWLDVFLEHISVLFHY